MDKEIIFILTEVISIVVLISIVTAIANIFNISSHTYCLKENVSVVFQNKFIKIIRMEKVIETCYLNLLTL